MEAPRAAPASIDGSELRALLRSEEKLLDAKVDVLTESVRGNIARRRIKATHLRVPLLLALLLALYVLVQVGLLALKYPKATAWYNDEVEADAASGFHAGPRPQGMFERSMREVQLAAEYPALAQAASVFFAQRELSRVGAQFLLRVVQAYGERLRGVHWSGSGAQLLLRYLPSHFLPHSPGDGVDDDWVRMFEGWSQRAPSGAYINPWADFFAFTAWQQMRENYAVREYVEAGPGSKGGTLMHALFEGGLCYVALVHASDAGVGRERGSALGLLHSIIGADVPPPPPRTCKVQQAQRGMDVFGLTAGLAISAVPPQFALLALGASAGASFFAAKQHSCS